MPAADTLTPTPTRLRDPRNVQHVREDLNLLRHGVLDFGSFRSGYRYQINPVEAKTTRLVADPSRVHPDLLVKDKSLFSEPEMWRGVMVDAAFGGRQRVLREVRRSHNLRVNQGRDLLNRGQMLGDISANATFTAVTGQSSAASATSLTVPTGLPTTGGLSGSLQGHIVWAANGTSGLVYGVILSNTATVITVDQWYNPTSATGAAGTTPAAISNFCVTPAFGMALYIGLSTASAAAAAGDVLRTADGLFADGTATGVATEQTANGLARTFTQPTFPAGGQSQLQRTFTYTGSTLVTIPKVILANSLAAAGSLLFLETLLNAQFSVNTNGDNAQITWTINN